MTFQLEKARASDPREKVKKPCDFFGLRRHLLSFPSYSGMTPGYKCQETGDIGRPHGDWLPHPKTPVPVLLKSINGLLFRPKSWESSLILFFQILIQSIATPVGSNFRPTLDPTSLHPFYRTHPNLSPHWLAYCSQLLPVSTPTTKVSSPASGVKIMLFLSALQPPVAPT